MHLSPELRLLRAPSAHYRDEVIRSAGGSAWTRALGRPLLSALLTGTCTAVAATGHAGWALILSGTLCWSFVVLVQLAAAIGLVSSTRRRTSLPRAIDLFFLGHGAWSLWLLAAAAALITIPNAPRYAYIIILTGMVPAVWTAIVIFAFCRQVLELDVRRAAIRTLVHQALIYAVVVSYFAWAVQLQPRILAFLAS